MSWWKYAKAGDKVVCVYQPELGWRFWMRWSVPAKGRIYTIREVRRMGDHIWEGCQIYISLKELGHEGFTSVAGFRPVQTRSTETGMSILKSLLTGADVKEGMDA
jgi:hypothetical protein